MSTWQTNSLRLTAFPSQPIPIPSEDWWMNVVGSEPEGQRSKRQTDEKTLEGQFSGGILTLTTNPLRIDWLYTPSEPSEDVAFNGFATIGMYEEKLPTFQKLITRWIDSTKEISLSRLAFGAVLLQPVDSREEGYNSLSQYLSRSLKIDPENSSDLLYQINRPRESITGIENLSINRLSKWSVLRLPLGLSSPIALQSIPKLPNIYAVRLELDINTAAEYEGELKQNQLLELFNEIVKLGNEIANEGDIL